VTPTTPRSHVASFDGAQQNSGFIGYTTNGFGVLTPHARDRYNSLIALGYGTNFVPRLTNDFGVAPFTNGTFLFTPEAVVDFGVMNQRHKANP
jgi:hypothetical protein